MLNKSMYPLMSCLIWTGLTAGACQLSENSTDYRFEDGPKSLSEIQVPPNFDWSTRQAIKSSIQVNPDTIRNAGGALLEFRSPDNQQLIYRGPMPANGEAQLNFALGIHLNTIDVSIKSANKTLHQATVPIRKDGRVQHIF